MNVLYVVRQRGSNTNGRVSLFSVLFFFCDTSPHFVSYPYSDSYFFPSSLLSFFPSLLLYFFTSLLLYVFSSFILSFFHSFLFFLLSSSFFFPLPSFVSEGAALVDGHKLIVYGGWNCDTQLSDCHMLDTDTLAWSSMVRLRLLLEYLLYLLYTPSVFLSSSHPHSSIAHA